MRLKTSYLTLFLSIFPHGQLITEPTWFSSFNMCALYPSLPALCCFVSVWPWQQQLLDHLLESSLHLGWNSFPWNRALFFCHSSALKLLMPSGGLLGFHRVQEGGRRPYAWATVQLSRCPARGALLLCPRREPTCQRCSTGTRKVANSSSAAVEAPALRPARGWFRERGEKPSKAGECELWGAPLLWAKSVGFNSWPLKQELKSPDCLCHLLKTLRQLFGLQKAEGILCPLFFRKFPSNVFPPTILQGWERARQGKHCLFLSDTLSVSHA